MFRGVCLQSKVTKSQSHFDPFLKIQKLKYLKIRKSPSHTFRPFVHTYTFSESGVSVYRYVQIYIRYLKASWIMETLQQSSHTNG